MALVTDNEVSERNPEVRIILDVLERQIHQLELYGDAAYDSNDEIAYHAFGIRIQALRDFRSTLRNTKID